MVGSSWFKVLSIVATVLALVVIVLGAYVRLSDAGLGCPDWPGCYGKVFAPTSQTEIESANTVFPERPVEIAKAWKEMVHRYFASFLGLLIVAMAAIAWVNRKQAGQQVLLPVFLVGLVIFQGMLGMWTVTLLLKPVVVTMHLLAGMLTLALLWFVTLNTLQVNYERNVSTDTGRFFKIWAAFALMVVYCQIALGGWTSTNYVALHCWGFPTCQGKWLPEMDFSEGFTLWRGLGKSYEGGVLSNAAGVAVHFSHRLGALLTFFIVGSLGVTLLFAVESRIVKMVSVAVLLLLVTQLSLGVANVLLHLPIPVAVSHNGVAALLLLSLVSLNFFIRIGGRKR
ncbi:MAG: COX15/CtaA family protein [Pseudomonadales bacterium]|nr:COX15/CtaA family protein [Pseudomonadales bacterium]